MEHILEILELILENAVHLCVIVFELVGVAIIAWTGIKAIRQLLRHNPVATISLAKGLCLGLEFKMGGEILKTVLVREWKEIGMVACIALLRAFLSLVLHWEMKEEAKELEEGKEHY